MGSRHPTAHGADAVRVHELGPGDRQPTPEQLDRMQALVRQAMEEGAMGIASAVAYLPALVLSAMTGGIEARIERMETSQRRTS